MNKFTFHNADKSIIRHNLVPEMLIEVIKLFKPQDYESADINIWSDIFNEKMIKGNHFVFLVINSDDFEDVEDFTQIQSILRGSAKWYQAMGAMGIVKIDKAKTLPSIFEDENFKLVQSDRDNWWLVAHKVTNIIIEFEEKKFNETQKISELTPTDLDMINHARLMREVGEWLAINHRNLI